MPCEALEPVGEQQQGAHAVAEAQGALDHELALGDEDGLCAAPSGPCARRRSVAARKCARTRTRRSSSTIAPGALVPFGHERIRSRRRARDASSRGVRDRRGGARRGAVPRLHAVSREPPDGALDQLLADEPLERRHLMAHRRLRVAEPARRARERALLRDRLEGHEVAHGERADPIEFVHAHTVPFRRDGARRPSRPARARVRAPARRHAAPARGGAGGCPRGRLHRRGRARDRARAAARLPHALAAAARAAAWSDSARLRARGRARATPPATSSMRSITGLRRAPRRAGLVRSQAAAERRRRSYATPGASSCSRTSTTTPTSARSSAAPRRSASTRCCSTPARCDPLYRRSLRISMGEALSLPHARTEAAAGRPRAAARGRLRTRRADARRRRRRHRGGRRRRGTTASPLLLGTEGAGLSPAVLAEADVRARIPLAARRRLAQRRGGRGDRVLRAARAAPGLAGESSLRSPLSEVTRLVAHGEVDRGGDEAERRRLVVQLLGALDHAGLGDGHDRAQHDVLEMPAAVGRLDHHALGDVFVGGHDHAVDGAAVEVREHVALAERRHEQQLGIPAVGVAAEGGIRRARDRAVGRSSSCRTCGRSCGSRPFPGRGRPSRSRASRTCVCGACR